MSCFDIHIDWCNESNETDFLFKQTTAELSIHANGSCLTKNINCWTEKVTERIRISAYPLAQWFAFNWWRLCNELAMPDDDSLSLDWHFAHDLGASDHGYVWPNLSFASDGEYMSIISKIYDSSKQSVNYVGVTNEIKTIPLRDFQKTVSSFIQHTIDRLSSTRNDLTDLWKIVQEDISSDTERIRREVEALMGYDPEECPREYLSKVVETADIIGYSSLKELAPMLRDEDACLQHVIHSRGIEGNIEALKQMLQSDELTADLPWKLGIAQARHLRNTLQCNDGKIENSQLCELLSLPLGKIVSYRGTMKLPVSIGKLQQNGKCMFLLHKTGIEGRRFECARLIGEAVRPRKDSTEEWLISSDLLSYQQKYQRAFAAEFLCPIELLDETLKGNYSEENVDRCAQLFGVSDYVVISSLYNHHRMQRFVYCPESVK